MRPRTYWMIILALLATLMGQCAGTMNPAAETSATSAAAQLDVGSCSPKDSR
jgi:hypothetical protein